MKVDNYPIIREGHQPYCSASNTLHVDFQVFPKVLNNSFLLKISHLAFALSKYIIYLCTKKDEKSFL